MLTTMAGVTCLAALALRRRWVASAAGLVWAANTGRLAWERIAPGPRDPKEIAIMLLTSIAIPPAATAWLAIGLARRRRLLTKRGGASRG